MAVVRFSYPPRPGSALFTQWSSLVHDGEQNGDVAEYTCPGGIPSSNAATNVNGLNAEPGCRVAVARSSWSFW